MQWLNDSSVRLCAILFFLVPGAAQAAEKPVLTRLPADKVAAMGRVLAHQDLALIESTPSGSLKQVTVMAWVAAPPKRVREVVTDFAHYKDFVPNMSKSDVTTNGDGTIDMSFVIRYTVVGFSGTERHWFRDDGSIDLDAMDPNDRARFHWEFHPAEGGTVLLMSGFTDVLHSPDLIKGKIAEEPTLEHGLALASQLVEVAAMKARAEVLAKDNGESIGLPTKTAPSLDYLLERGDVVLIRSRPDGKLAELDVAGQIARTSTSVAATIGAPEEYPRFMEAVKKTHLSSRTAVSTAFSATVDLAFASFDSQYAMRTHGREIEIGVVDGDLKGAKYRWELTARGPNRTDAVLRAREDIAASSLVLRALFSQEAHYEAGFGAALCLADLRGIRARAEGKK
jgi:ribosome-associated toxin RatA of RatAB toxin-antitoxin module